MERISLSAPQSVVWLALQIVRFCVLVAGRRFGKTWLALSWLIEGAAKKPRSRNWYVAPTYTQAEMIAWSLLKEMIPPEKRLYCNETKLLIILHNGSEIQLKGADKPDSLRGVGVDRLVLDEYADMQDAWQDVFEPLLADRLGQCLFIGTPRGFNHFYDIYNNAFKDPEHWRAFQFTSLEGGNIPKAEIERLRRTIDPRIFRQEYEGRFENLQGRVYYNFDRRFNSTKIVDAGADLLGGMDFNVDPMTAIIAQKAGRQAQIFREFVLHNSNTREMARAIKQAFPNRSITIYPDPTGGRRQTNANLGETDHKILREEGLSVYVPDKPYLVADKYNTVNALLLNAEGERNLLVDPSCTELIKGFEGLTYKKGTNLADTSTGLDHETDAAAYMVCGAFPMFGTATKVKTGRLRI